MKRTIAIFAVMLLVASCKTDPPVPPGPPEPVPGTSYLLEGTINTPGFTWNNHSVIGLYSTDVNVVASNLQCKIEGWEDPTPPVIDDENKGDGTRASAYNGKAVARFATPPMDLVKGNNTFLVYSPYNSELVYLNGMIYGLEVAAEQTQSAPGVAGNCFAIGSAVGVPGVDETFAFSMVPVTALANVSVSTSEFAGYSLEKVTIWDDADESTAFAGGFNVNTATLAFNKLETYNRVSTVIAAPAPLASGKAQNLFINLLPGDFSSKELWVIVELTKGVERVTIPMKKTGLSFSAGQTTEISVSDLKLSDNAASAWYNPVEKRYLPALGYAYGDANTYFIQCKNGSTYTGATYAADAAYPDEVTIDFRASGNFFNVIDPRGATFEWAKLGPVQANGNGNGAVYAPRLASYEGNGVKVDGDTFTITPGETTVKVKNVGAFAGAPILMMIKDNKILWAWTFWNIAADGTKVEAIDVGSYKLANMDIGQSTTQYSTWAANKSGSNADPVFRTTHFYQWGRPVPIFWTTFWSVRVGERSGNCPGLYGPYATFAESIANPVGIIINETQATDLPNWCDEKLGDLWGNCNEDADATGVKSIYDPCPKGWRVADRAVYNHIVAQEPTSGNGFTYENTNGMVGIRLASASNNLFLTQGYSLGKTITHATDVRLHTMGGMTSATPAGCKFGMLWTNYAASHEATQPSVFRYGSSGDTSVAPSVNGFYRSVTAAIRCQVDAENR